MKKYLVLLLCLLCIAPAFSNTVKQNNYSEDLNTEAVNDFVTKKIKVNTNGVETKIDGYNDSRVNNGILNQAQTTTTRTINRADEYINYKLQNIETLKAKQAEMNHYFDAKINDLQAKMEEIKAKSNAKTEAQKATIVSLYQRQIDEMTMQKTKVIAKLQDDIDKFQNEINEIQNSVK